MGKENNNTIEELKEIIQSANINFLLGSGVSKPFLPTLLNIEKDINQAIENGDQEAQIKGYKEYLEKIMLPNKRIIFGNFSKDVYGDDRTEELDYQDTKEAYMDFFQTLTNLILERKTTIISKQINIFTTNIDIFLETILEEMQLDYNDGFSGRLNPVFSLANFKKSIFQRSLQFDHKSEIPTFNIFKIHGSLTWRYDSEDKEKIVLSPKIKHIDDELKNQEGDDFIEQYKENILVVNPENTKFSETVLNKYYYELLRLYSNELERENSVLFVIGFSMDDQHIKEITQRVAKANPTLKICIFVHSKDQTIDGVLVSNKEIMEKKMEVDKFPNITIVAPEYDKPEDIYKFNLKTVTEKFFKELIDKKDEV